MKKQELKQVMFSVARRLQAHGIIVNECLSSVQLRYVEGVPVVWMALALLPLGCGITKRSLKSALESRPCNGWRIVYRDFDRSPPVPAVFVACVPCED